MPAYFACLCLGAAAAPVPHPSAAASSPAKKISLFEELTSHLFSLPWPRLFLSDDAELCGLKSRFAAALEILSRRKRTPSMFLSSLLRRCELVVEKGAAVVVDVSSTLRASETDGECGTEEEDVAFPEAEAQKILLLQRSSGSTSQPKRCCLSAGALLWSVHLSLRFGEWKPTAEGDCLCCAPVSSSYAKLFEKQHALSKELYGHRVRMLSWLPFFHDMG